MGIRGLNHFIQSHSKYFLEPYELRNTYLIIDARNVSTEFLLESCGKNGKLGGNYDLYARHVEEFYSTLTSCNITPIVMLDGILENLQKYVHMFTNEEEKQFTNNGHAKALPILLPDVYRDISRKMGIQVLCPIFEADDSIAALAEALDCPVLSCDTDFYVYGVKYIPYQTFSWRIRDRPEESVLPCKIYRVEKLLNNFKGLKKSLLPLALELLKHGYMASETLKPFFKVIAPVPKYTVPNTLNWLSQFRSLNAAVEELLRYVRVDLRLELVERLEKNISRFSVASASILPFLNLGDSVINELREKKEMQRFKFQCCSNRPDLMVSENRDGDKDLYCVSEEELIAAAPEWLYRDFVTGIIRGTVMKLFVYYFQVSRLKIGTAGFPPTCEADIPLITRMFELIISTVEEEGCVLRVQIKDDDNKVRDVNVKKWPVDLREVRCSAVCERLKIINDVLGIKKERNLRKLPEKWRLYVATIIYWKRQKYQLEVTNVHLLSLLFTMLFGIDDDKIEFKRPVDRDQCGEELEDYNFYENDEKSESNDNRRINGYSKSMNVMDSMTKEDCVATAGFFRSHSIMPDDEFELLSGDWVNFVDTFRQFQKSLMFVIQLNALLGYPYTHPPIHELYSGTLLYSVFVKFSRAKNIDHYMDKKLRNSPRIVSVLKLLKKIVLHELEIST